MASPLPKMNNPACAKYQNSTGIREHAAVAHGFKHASGVVAVTAAINLDEVGGRLDRGKTVLLRDPRDPVLHLFTHAGLYIPREVMSEVTRRAKVAAVFMLPSGGELHLEYLDLLDAHWVVDHQVLANRGERMDEARRILDDVGVRSTEPDASPRSRKSAPVSKRAAGAP